ncbi:MAG: PAS domain S-box protein [Rhizobiales bacterium]|nr:PAS domain S-box protein [Hyphomicrobiales bacterium]
MNEQATLVPTCAIRSLLTVAQTGNREMQASNTRQQQIRLELLQSLMQSQKYGAELGVLLSGLFCLGLESNWPIWVIDGWFLMQLCLQTSYGLFLKRNLRDPNLLEKTESTTRKLTGYFALTSVGWTVMIPLFWIPGNDSQNHVLLTIMIVHSLISALTVYHVRAFSIALALPSSIMSVFLCFFMLDDFFTIFGLCLVALFINVAYGTASKRLAAEETIRLRLRNANLIRDLAAARDLSEMARNSAEEANDLLLARENRFRALVENAFDMILVTNNVGVITYTTPSLSRLGFDPETIIGQNVRDLLPADDFSEIMRKEIDEEGRTSKIRQREFYVKENGYNKYYLKATITDMRDDDSIQGYVINMSDITQRKRNEHDLENHLQVLQDLTQGRPLQEVMTRLALGAEATNSTARAAVFLIDENNNLSVCAAPSLPASFHRHILRVWDNHQNRLFGKAAMAGQRIITTDLQNPEHGEDIAEMAREINAQTIWFEPIIGANGKIVGSIALYFQDKKTPDTTAINFMKSASHVASIAVERRRADKELRRAKEAAELANRSKTKFLANMSHELRTPLNAIIGFSEIMENNMFGPLGSARYTEYATDINNSGKHLLSVIDDILDIAKIEAGQMKLHVEDVDLTSVINWSVDMVRSRTNEKHQSIKRHLPDNLPALKADLRAMRQVMLNILSNAMKFTPAHGEISISGNISDDGNLVITVADNGIGIPADKLEEVLQPFGQVDDAVSRQHGGTGLGLPITKSLIESQGGRFYLESEMNKGTRVIIVWPLSRLQLPQYPESKAAAS